jgi:hypothetical protein
VEREEDVMKAVVSLGLLLVAATTLAADVSPDGWLTVLTTDDGATFAIQPARIGVKSPAGRVSFWMRAKPSDKSKFVEALSFNEALCDEMNPQVRSPQTVYYLPNGGSHTASRENSQLQPIPPGTAMESVVLHACMVAEVRAASTKK